MSDTAPHAASPNVAADGASNQKVQASTTDKATTKLEENRPRYTSGQRFLLLRGALGVYFCFITSGRMQEKVFRATPKGVRFDAVWFLQLIDAMVNVLTGAIGKCFEEPAARLPQDLMAMSSVIQVFSKWSFNTALAAGLSFAAATLAKSAKMVPVMIGSLFMGGMTFSRRDVAQASAIVAGTSIVSLAESRGSGKSSTWKGLAFIIMALACDGWVAGIQRRIKTWCRSSGVKERPYDFMMSMNVYMAVTAFVLSVVTNDLRKGITFCSTHKAVLRNILLQSLFGALGQAFVFDIMVNFDSVVVSQVTTTRKLASVLISVLTGEALPNKWATGAGIALAGAGVAGEVL